MRVIDELAVGYPSALAVSNGCVNPNYGQAEDYPVFIAAALPIKLDYFKGVKQNNDALLSWKTSFEQDTKEFGIEKSTDGSTFTDIGTVPASNNSAGSGYSFTDKNISGPVNYYRLKQIDLNGNGELSEIVIIKSEDGISGKLTVNNPFTDKLEIDLSNTQVTNTTINLFDITGRKIYRADFKAGTQHISIDL